jgi:hypothetical protein
MADQDGNQDRHHQDDDNNNNNQDDAVQQEGMDGGGGRQEQEEEDHHPLEMLATGCSMNSTALGRGKMTPLGSKHDSRDVH